MSKRQLARYVKLEEGESRQYPVVKKSTSPSCTVSRGRNCTIFDDGLTTLLQGLLAGAI